MKICKNYDSKSKVCRARECGRPIERYITFTKENREKNKSGLKTETRRVTEKVDQFKNLKPGDILLVIKNRYVKKSKRKVLQRLKVLHTWQESLHDITYPGIAAEGFAQNFKDNRIALKAKFIQVWNVINRVRGYAWHTNPKVRAIRFYATN